MSRPATAGASDWAASARLRVPHLLGTVTLEPRGMAPSATLIVRRLRDPLPRGLMADPDSVSATRAWDHAAQNNLTDLYRNAARPASGPISGSAPAVLFTDQAELLACLARDLLRGVASSLWWWRAILRSLPSGALAALFEAWRRDAAYVPAALARLASQEMAVPVMNALSPAQAWFLLDSVVHAFDLQALQAVLRSPVAVGSRPESQLEPVPSPSPVHAQAPAPAFDLRMSPPWRSLVSASNFPEGFGIERSALLGVSLALQAAPSLARSRQFAQAFSSWRSSVLLAHLRSADERLPASLDQSARLLPTPAKSPDTPEQQSENEKTGPASSPPAESPAASPQGRVESANLWESHATDSPGVTGQPDATAPSEPALTTALPEARERAEAPPSNPLPVETSAALDLSHSSPSQAPAETAINPDRLAPPPSIQPILPPPGDAWFGDPIQTELGGILFLVSLLKALRLPASIQESCGCEFEIGSWELLELVARCLLGPRNPHLIFDPIWKALAALDGRAPEQPAGANVTGLSCYRLPQAWIDTLPDAISSPAVRFRRGGFELWHPTGVLLAKEIHPIAPLTSQRRHRSPWSGCAPLGMTPNGSLRRFLAFLMPYIRWRLASSLGLPRISHRQLAETLLFRPATVWLTSTHVDLVMNLNQASGPVRLSGLDTDPGWLPAFGRVVKFHYRSANAL